MTRDPTSLARRLVPAGLALVGACLLGTCGHDKLVGPPLGGILEVAPRRLADSAALGSRAARVMTVAIANATAGELAWTATRLGASPWLSLGATSGTAPRTLYAAADPTGLAVGVYSDTIVVTASSPARGEARIPIQFVIHPCTVWVISLDVEVAGRLDGADCTGPHRDSTFADLYRFAGLAGDSVSVELESAEFTPYLILDTAAASSAPPLAESSTCAHVPRTPCLRYQRLPRNGTFVIEATTAVAGDSGAYRLRLLRPRPPSPVDSLTQLRRDSVTAIATGGVSADSTIVLGGAASDPDGGDSLRLEVEVQPVGAAFTGAATGVGALVPAGGRAFARVSGLSDNTAYHWRARVVDQTGRASAWAGFGGNVEVAPDFHVRVPPTQLVFTVPPGTSAPGAAITPAVQVAAQDGAGNTLTSFTVPIAVALGSNPAGGTLSGTRTVDAVAGVATFADLRIDRTGSGYTLVASATGLAATSGAFGITPGPPVRLAITTQPSATAQSGVPFAQQPMIQLYDTAGNAVSHAGDTVRGAIASGGGALGGTTAVLTNASGVAAFTDLLITGTGGGPRTLQFSATGLTGVPSDPVELTAGPPSQAAVNAGDDQSATAGTAVAVLPSVIVRDASGNAVSGVAVTFAAAPGHGTVSPVTPVLTNASGVAAVASWTLGTMAGTDSLTATTSPGLTGNPVVFTATATVGAPATLAKVSGDNLTGAVGSTLGTPHDVTVRDVHGNPVRGVTISWAAGAGGGSVSPALDTTHLDGRATTVRTLGSTAGIQTTTATATLSGGPTTVTFSITATVGPASQMSIQAGGNQVDTVGQTVPTPLAVRVADAFDNPVAGVVITWAVVDGGGSLSQAADTTDAGGIASTSWTLGTAMTPTDSVQLVQATGVASPLTFTAFTVPGPVSATQTSVTAFPAAVTASSGSSGSTLTVTARDPFGNVVKGKPVVLAATGTGNTLTQPATTTNASGVVTGTLSATAAGDKVVAATIDGIGVTQTATVMVAAAAVHAGQSTVVAAPTTITASTGASSATITVTARDPFGNPIAGATVILGATGSGTTLTQPLGPTNTSGVVTGTLSATAAGDKVVAATIDGTGVTQTAMVTVVAAGVHAGQSTVVAAPTTITASTGASSATVTVTARDPFGNPIAGATVVLAATGTGNSLTQPASPTDANGVATGTLSSTGPETKTVSATANGTAITQTASVTVTVPVAAVEVAPASASVGVGVTVQLTATPRDAAGNPLSGRVVNWATSDAAVATVDGSGLVTGVALGSVTITATSEGQNGTATVTVAAPVASVEITPASASVQEGATIQLTATPQDASGNPLSGRGVTWASSDVAVTTVNGSGLVSGLAEGSATVTATSEGLGGSSAITVTASPPCLTRTGPTITLSGVIASAYANTGLADNTKIDASTAQFLSSANTPVRVDGGSNTCFHGGEVIGMLPPSTEWSTMHETFAFLAGGMPYFVLEHVRAFDYGDGASMARNVTTPTKWTLRGVHFKYIRDDCVENDFLNPGTIEDSFFDGCYVAFSSRPYTATQDGSNNVVVVQRSLFRLQDMDQGFSKPGHGGFFKWHPQAPRVVLYNNVYRVDSPNSVGNQTLAPPAGKLKDCANNVMIWLGSGPFPEALPSCYTVLTGAEGLQYWNNAVAAWKADHPKALLDVGPPIVSMYAPADSTTLTGTVTLRATAVDDQDVAGVRFTLSGQNVGPEVTSESPLTKFTLSWDSQSVPNGTYLLTATARDASGNTQTSAGITVTITNAAGVSPGQSTVVAAPGAIPVGSGMSTITVTAQDANGNPIAGAAVVLAATGSGALLTQPAGLTGANGVAIGTLSATLSGTKVVSAVVDGTPIAQTASVTVTPPPGSVVLVGAGDIGDCGTATDEATATLLDVIPGAVFTAGDNAYPNGAAIDFTTCYAPTWGRHKARTSPSPGNHDYRTAGASDYFAYFGASAGPAGRGYYSYDLGDWHLISLNSEISMSAGSAQELWLRADLAANTKQCTLAYWHKPRFSSGFHGSLSGSGPLWAALYEYNAEVVVVGHDHNYERFAPQTETGVADPARGLRQFVVGTGGTDLRSMETLIANSEVQNSTTHGVLKLTLHSSGYEWEFIPVAGKTFTDSGSGSCH